MYLAFFFSSAFHFFIVHYSILSFCKECCLLWFFFFQCRIIVYFKNIDRLSDVQLTVIKLDRKGILLLVFFYIIIFLLVWVWWRSLAFSIRESTCSDCDQLCKKKGELLHHGSLLHSTNHTHTHTLVLPLPIQRIYLTPLACTEKAMSVCVCEREGGRWPTQAWQCDEVA